MNTFEILTTLLMLCFMYWQIRLTQMQMRSVSPSGETATMRSRIQKYIRYWPMVVMALLFIANLGVHFFFPPKVSATMPLHWTLTQAEEEVVYGKQFRYESVEIDGKKFDHCTFENVTIVYHATAPVDFVEVTWAGNVFLETDNDAAKGFVMLSESLKATMSQLPNRTFGIGGVDKNGNIVQLPLPQVRVNK